MLNLSRILDCFSRRFGKVVFNLKLSNLVDLDVASQSIHTAFCYIPVNFAPNSRHYVTSYMHHRGKNRVKNKKKIIISLQKIRFN